MYTHGLLKNTNHNIKMLKRKQAQDSHFVNSDTKRSKNTPMSKSALIRCIHVEMGVRDISTLYAKDTRAIMFGSCYSAQFRKVLSNFHVFTSPVMVEGDPIYTSEALFQGMLHILV